MTPAERAQSRRLLWRGGLVRPGQMRDHEREFWARASAAQRLAAVWELAEQIWYLEHPHGPPLRLDRSVGGVRSRGG